MSLVKQDSASIVEQVLVSGDLARLTSEQRVQYYRSVCDSLGLNYLTRPFDYITLNGKLTFYAKKDCTDQLRKIHSVSIRITDRSIMDDLVIVTCEATTPTGRVDSSIGAVSIAGLKGESKANALMKAETKARRRVTLSLCGLGILDESEIDDTRAVHVRAEPRAADQLIQAGLTKAAPALPASPVVAAEAAPALFPAAQEEPVDQTSGTDNIVVQEITEHKTKSSIVWKVIDKAGGVWACFDELLVADLSEYKTAGTRLWITWEKKSSKRAIITAEEYA